MKFAQGMAKITFGRDNYKRSSGIWLFTDSKTGKLAWSKNVSDGENLSVNHSHMNHMLYLEPSPL